MDTIGPGPENGGPAVVRRRHCSVCGKDAATVSFVRDSKATPPRCLPCIRTQSEANLAATTRPGTVARIGCPGNRT